jgi:hypothetical protein
MRKILLVIFLLVCLSIAGIAFLPASVIERSVNERLTQRGSSLRLGCSFGNVGSGGAQLLMNSKSSPVALAQIRWRWQWAQLLTASASFAITGFEPQACSAGGAGGVANLNEPAPEQVGTGNIKLRLYQPSTLLVNDMNYVFSERVVGQLMDSAGERNIGIKLAQPRGTLGLQANDWAVSAQSISAGATLTASDVKLNTSLGQFIGRDLGAVDASKSKTSRFTLTTRSPESGQLLAADIQSTPDSTQKLDASITIDQTGKGLLNGKARIGASPLALPVKLEFSVR